LSLKRAKEYHTFELIFYGDLICDVKFFPDFDTEKKFANWSIFDEVKA